MAPKASDPLAKARTAQRESKYVEFKERFDPSSTGEWCELIKDLVAVANSGGGIVVVGVRNNGSPSGQDVKLVLELDAAKITDKIFKYSGEHFSGFELHDIRRGNRRAAAIVIHAARTPIAFTAQGAYQDDQRKHKSAFARGTVYFRHGAKSEPATTQDLAEFIERRIDAVREAWLGDVRKVIYAPPGAQVEVIRQTSADPSGGPATIQVTTDPQAPVYGKLDPDKTHPYRQTDLIPVVNRKLPGKKTVNSHDILSVRRAHDISAETRPEFCHQPRFASAQYSEAFADWLVEQYKKDKSFFDRARDEYYARTHR